MQNFSAAKLFSAVEQLPLPPPTGVDGKEILGENRLGNNSKYLSGKMKKNLNREQPILFLTGKKVKS